jgi:4-hydroxyphenylpyruvate dioxygenase
MRPEQVDYVELYVGNALQSAHFYRTALGFQAVAYSGPETGVRDRISYLMKQGDVKLLLTSPLGSGGPIANHLNSHGDGVRDIALTVSDARAAFDTYTARGAKPVVSPHVTEDEHGRVVSATVGTFGDTVHTLVERKGYDGFLPEFRECRPRGWTQNGLKAIDHFAAAVEPGGVSRWAEFYEEVFGLRLSLVEETVTGYSSMNSKVVQTEDGGLIFVFVEPGPGKRKSPIQEYLTFYEGEGVHHIAMSCHDIVESVRSLRDHGLDFTCTPGTYYETLTERVGEIEEDVRSLSELGILVDRDEWGYLLQIFSQPVQGRPTFFYEIIQRVGAKGFGSGNVKALFEAIERAQLLRGNA